MDSDFDKFLWCVGFAVVAVASMSIVWLAISAVPYLVTVLTVLAAIVVVPVMFFLLGGTIWLLAVEGFWRTWIPRLRTSLSSRF